MHLHRLTSRLAKLVYHTYSVYTPECNAAPLLWRAVRSLEGSRKIWFYRLVNPVLLILFECDSLPVHIHEEALCCIVAAAHVTLLAGAQAEAD